MELHILNENTVYKRGYFSEHGLSVLIEYEGKRFLFDMGQTDVFMRNAAKMNQDLDTLDGIILSHGHYDHCGGMADFIEKRKKMPPVYIQETAFYDKLSFDKKQDMYRSIGITWKSQECENLHLLKGSKEEIADHMYLLSQVPYTVEFEKPTEEFFYVDEDEMKRDLMMDEQILVIDGKQGLSVFLGCSHPGIINCLKYVESCFPDKKIYSVFAGMHLLHCNKERLEKTIMVLEAMMIPVVIPVHCTGMYAIGRIKEALGEHCMLTETGRHMTL